MPDRLIRRMVGYARRRHTARVLRAMLKVQNCCRSVYTPGRHASRRLTGLHTASRGNSPTGSLAGISVMVASVSSNRLATETAF